MTWFDLPQNSVAVTADNDANVTAVEYADYSGDYLNSTTLALSVNVSGDVSGGVPNELYVALPAGKSAQGSKAVPVSGTIEGAAVPMYAVGTGTVVTVRRADGGDFTGHVVLRFTSILAV